MNERRSPLAAGLAAALRHRRLAAVLWLAGLVALLPVLPALVAFTRRWDEGPFRETILKGWDGWAIASWFAFNPGDSSAFSASANVAVLLGALLYVVLVPGVLRVLVSDVNRPVLRRVVAESAALLRPNLWGFARYVVSLAFWEGVIVGLPVRILGKLKGDEAPPNGPLDSVIFWWAVVAGTVVFLNVSARWGLARVALALDDSPTARGAYRVAKKRLKGARAGAVGIGLFWIVVGAILQALFTNAGVALNPGSGGGVFGLFVLRQAGFLLLAATRVGYWGSLLAFERAERPAPSPVRAWQPLPRQPFSSLASPLTVPLPDALPRPEAEPEVAAGNPAWQTASQEPPSGAPPSHPEPREEPGGTA